MFYFLLFHDCSSPLLTNNQPLQIEQLFISIYIFFAYDTLTANIYHSVVVLSRIQKNKLRGHQRQLKAERVVCLDCIWGRETVVRKWQWRVVGE